MDISTIIVNYNTHELTAGAVRSALDAAEGLRHEVIIVDNSSPDGSAERLTAAFPDYEYPNVQVIANGENIGFSRANNIGAAVACGGVFFFLNPDTIVHGKAVRVLYDFLMQHPEAGAVGPHVLNSDGSDQLSSFPFFSAGWMVRHYLPVGSLLRGSVRRQFAVPAETQKVDIVYGCALAIRRDILARMGGWDESYFMYAEETELCYALARAGYSNYFVREAQITHFGGASSLDNYAEQQIIQAQSMVRFIDRHHPNLQSLHRLLGILGYGVRAGLYYLALLRPSAGAAARRRAVAALKLFRWFLHYGKASDSR